MTTPLADPVLEAAAQINFASLRHHLFLQATSLDTVRRWIMQQPRACHEDMLAEAAHQIDALRAAGVIPKGGENG